MNTACMSKEKKVKSKSILFLTPYPQGVAASQRFRFEQYFPHFPEHGFNYTQKSFFSINTWNILYLKGHEISKALGILSGFIRRIYHLFLIFYYDYIFIHREVTPVGPPLFEFLIGKVFRRKIIYDFDDATWMPNTSEANKIIAGLKWHSKVGSICAWSNKISCGNDYLKEYARSYNPDSRIIPTTIDTESLHNRIKDQDSPSLIIGWTGTHSTLKYLDLITAALIDLKQKVEFEFLIICDRDPELKNIDYRFISWSKAKEIDDLLRINIGVMPLTGDEWSKGKCGFKALQFMSLGIPVLVSPMGINQVIVDHDQNGYHCEEKEDWISYVEKLINDRVLRSEMGINGRKKVEDQYSTRTNLPAFLDLFT